MQTMTSPINNAKAAGKRCGNCNALPLEADIFCRRCGIHRGDPTEAINLPSWQNQATTTLEPGFRSSSLQNSNTLSRRSLETFSQAVAMRTGPLRLGRFGALMVSVLIAIPMWLLIILLSPLDAYLSARAASSQIGMQ